jgi:uncharacterized protein
MSEAFQRHGAFSWCELMTTDVAAAKRFYTQLLGWTTEDVAMPGAMAGMTPMKQRVRGGLE